MMRFLLRLSAAFFLAAGFTVCRGEQPVCELYVPGHFGNSYEAAGVNEMQRIITEAQHWGYNGYADWFDTMDCANPFADRPNNYRLGNAMWDLKKAHFRTAQSLGMATDLVITPNHVFLDQIKPEWLAESGPHIASGTQLVCPHRPEARKVILENYTNLFADLAKSGVSLTAITAAPYDYGGCACKECNPWILTFAQLTLDIYKIAQTYHPKVKLRFIGWWWKPEEHRLFAQWMDEHAPGVATAMALEIPYNQAKVASVPLPKGCKKYAFVHIGYPNRLSPRDIYQEIGPVVAPERMAETVRNLNQESVTGVMAYSEGIYDDVNKALLGGLFTGQYTNASKLLQAYAQRYFAADDVQARRWSDWLTLWGTPFSVDAIAARKTFDQLSGQPLDWRRRQWEFKADLFAANQRIGVGDEWPAARRADAEQFWATEEKLQREVYRVGPVRQILSPRYL